MVLVVCKDPAVTGMALLSDFTARDRVCYRTAWFTDVFAISKLTMAQPGAHLDKTVRKFSLLEVHQGKFADTR